MQIIARAMMTAELTMQAAQEHLCVRNDEHAIGSCFCRKRNRLPDDREK